MPQIGAQSCAIAPGGLQGARAAVRPRGLRVKRLVLSVRTLREKVTERSEPSARLGEKEAEGALLGI